MNPPPATAAKAPAAASQHAQPKSDIEIAQAAKKRPILDIAREKLGIAPENLEPYGHYKAKVSMDFIKSTPGPAERQAHPGHRDQRRRRPAKARRRRRSA